jgi:hypothetical protein
VEESRGLGEGADGGAGGGGAEGRDGGRAEGRKDGRAGGRAEWRRAEGRKGGERLEWQGDGGSNRILLIAQIRNLVAPSFFTVDLQQRPVRVQAPCQPFLLPCCI